MKRVVAVAGTAVCALVAAVGVHLWATSGDTGTSPEHTPVPRLARPPRNGGLADGDVAAAAGSLALRGRVVGPAGPVAGAVVAAFAPYDVEKDPLAQALCAGVKPDEEGLTEVDPFDCGGGEEASVAVGEAFASRSTERPALARATTGADGRFALEGLAAGSYDLWAEREGGFARLAGQEAPADELELKLEPGVLVHGKVEVNGNPPLGPLLVSGAAAGFPRIFEAQTGEEGAFSLGPVPAMDRAIVSTLLEGYLGAHEVVEGLGSERGADSEVVLNLDSPRRITGVVMDDRGPAAGVTVSLEGDADDVPDVTTDPAGRFTFEHVRPGDFNVSATRPFAVGHESVTVPSDRDPPPLTVDLAPVGVVRGVIRDDGGRPVPDATVFLTGHEVVHTGADGRFELTEAGAVERLLVRAEGFLSVDEELRIPAGTAVEKEISLQRALLLRGTVVDEVGQPIHLANLVIRDETSADGNQASTDKDGAFELETAAARTEVEVEAQGYVTVRRPMAAATPERVVLRKGGSLLVRLLDTEGHPVPDAMVAAVPLRGSAERRTVGSHRVSNTLSNEYLMEGLTAGDYRLEVRTDAQTEVRVARSDGRARQELEVRLPAPGKISGVVVSSTGAPLADTYVRATEVLDGDRGRSGASSRTNERGEFHLPARRGGRYTLFAMKDNRPPATGVAAAVDGAPVKIVLAEPAKVRGRVLYPDGAPASGFVFNGERVKGVAGRFEQEVGSGDLHLTLAAPGYAPRLVNVTIQPGEDRDLGDLALGEGRTVAVRVVDARTNQPVGGASVHVTGIDATGDPELATSLDEPARRTRTDGSAALTHVPDGAVVCVDADGYQSATAPVGPGTSEVVRLEPNGALRVFLDDPFEGPLWVTIEGPEDHTVPLDPRAGATFSKLPSGGYTVALWRSPPVSGQKWKGVLAPVQPREISFPMEGTGEVHFRLRAEGTDVVVTVNGVAPDADMQTVLIPERVDLAELRDSPLSVKLEQIMVPERPGQHGPARFAHVPDGTYRVAAMIFGSASGGMYVDPRPLVLGGANGAGGPREVTLTVPDDWRPDSD